MDPLYDTYRVLTETAQFYSGVEDSENDIQYERHLWHLHCAELASEIERHQVELPQDPDEALDLLYRVTRAISARGEAARPRSPLSSSLAIALLRYCYAPTAGREAINCL